MKHAVFQEIVMNEEVLNSSLRKYLKTVGVTSQREIEKAIRAAVASGRIKGNEALKAKMVLTIGEVGLNHEVDGVIELD
jgi:predicted lactoylglutathione lyase